MELFNSGPNINLLPCDGIVNYYGKIVEQEKALFYLARLLETIAWQHDEAIIFGKHYITKRKAAWYGDRDFDYSYSNTTKKALKWTEELLELKSYAEKISGYTYNSCLLNLYHSGEEGVSWHSDDEKSLVSNSAIASFSFGAERKFTFKHKISKQSISIILENGSLLVMKGSTQKHWLHCLPKSKKVNSPRVNLTFRKMVEN